MKMIYRLLEMEWVLPFSIQDLFLSCKLPSYNTLINNLWKFILPYLCWGVWKERNDRVFRGKESNSNQIFHKIKSMVIENIRLSGKIIQPHDEWEAKLIKNWKVEGIGYSESERNLRSMDG